MTEFRTTAVCAGLLLAATLPFGAGAHGADDPWQISAPSGIEHVMTITQSDKAYTILLAGEPWEGADGPKHATVPMSDEERAALAKCVAVAHEPDQDAALAAIDEFLAAHPSNWDAHVVGARVLHAKEADADAAAALRTALIGNRRNPDAWKLLEDVGASLGKRVVRPELALRGWVRVDDDGDCELGHVADDDDGMSWNYYAAARAVYRHEGPFARDFPAATSYAFTFREQMYAMGVLSKSAAEAKKDRTKLGPALKRVLKEKRARTLVPFTFFAVYTEPVPAAPESRWDALLPRLERYFDQKILVRRASRRR